MGVCYHEKNHKLFYGYSYTNIFCGCSYDQNHNSNEIKAPTNSNLEIEGIWDAVQYTVLDKNILNNKGIYEILNSSIHIGKDFIEISNERFTETSYRLKAVKNDYVISYEAKYIIKDLTVSQDSFHIYSIMYNNNVLCEFIKMDSGPSYLYYQGILFSVTYNGELSSEEEKDIDVIHEKDQEDKGQLETIAQGIYLGLKTGAKIDKNGDYIREKYRTLWISSKLGIVQTVKERNNIIVPRKQMMWTISPYLYEDNERNIYYEYFDAMPLDASDSYKSQVINKELLKDNTIVKRNIVYIGSDYISTKVGINNLNEGTLKYELLPIDNVNCENGVSIEDVFGEESRKIFEQGYNSLYDTLGNEFRSKLRGEIDYSNFGLNRIDGKWIFEGRILASEDTGNIYRFPLDIKDSSNVLENQTLVIPWKILKGKLPLLVDAYTSPKGSLAVIVLENSIEIYNVKGGKLEEVPSKRISLNKGESVIMSEWCEGSYVDKWAMPFTINSRTIQ